MDNARSLCRLEVEGPPEELPAEPVANAALEAPESLGRDFSVVALSEKHERIAEYLLMNPASSRRELAQAFGMSETWIGTLANSDLFRAYLQRRRAEIVGGTLHSLYEKTAAVASKSLDALSAQLDDPSNSAEFVLASTDKLLHSLGFAPGKRPGEADRPQGATAAVQVNFSTSADDISRARRELEASHGR